MGPLEERKKMRELRENNINIENQIPKIRPSHFGYPAHLITHTFTLHLPLFTREGR
jgi:hypothetical protein